MRKRIVKFTAPAYWAPYLINGDASGLDPDEGETPESVDAAVIAYIGEGYSVVDCDDEPSFSWGGGDVSITGLGCDILEYRAIRSARTAKVK